MAGWDTDTNAGDVGPVLGVILGAKKLPAKWTGPIANTFRCDVRGAKEWAITDLAARTAAAGRRLIAERSDKVRIVD